MWGNCGHFVSLELYVQLILVSFSYAIDYVFILYYMLKIFKFKFGGSLIEYSWRIFHSRNLLCIKSVSYYCDNYVVLCSEVDIWL